MERQSRYFILLSKNTFQCFQMSLSLVLFQKECPLDHMKKIQIYLCLLQTNFLTFINEVHAIQTASKKKITNPVNKKAFCNKNDYSVQLCRTGC